LGPRPSGARPSGGRPSGGRPSGRRSPSRRLSPDFIRSNASRAAFFSVSSSLPSPLRSNRLTISASLGRPGGRRSGSSARTATAVPQRIATAAIPCTRYAFIVKSSSVGAGSVDTRAQDAPASLVVIAVTGDPTPTRVASSADSASMAGIGAGCHLNRAASVAAGARSSAHTAP